MSASDVFFDTDILLYLLSPDAAKADRAEALLAAGGAVSVQVLNEFAHVATRKFSLRIAEAREFLATIRAVATVLPLDEGTHDLGLDIAERHRLSIFDGLIVASALQAGCRTLLTEDLHHGHVIDRLVVQNPFRDGPSRQSR